MPRSVRISGHTGASRPSCKAAGPAQGNASPSPCASARPGLNPGKSSCQRTGQKSRQFRHNSLQQPCLPHLTGPRAGKGGGSLSGAQVKSHLSRVENRDAVTRMAPRGGGRGLVVSVGSPSFSAGDGRAMCTWPPPSDPDVTTSSQPTAGPGDTASPQRCAARRCPTHSRPGALPELEKIKYSSSNGSGGSGGA